MLITNRIETLTKSQSITISVGLAFAGSILLALLARLSFPVPFSPVPITGQTFGVLFLGALLGSRIGTLSVIMYIVEGMLGLPIFAGLSFGFLYLLGPTGGYLIGFIPAAFTVGYLIEKGFSNRVLTTFLTMVIGTTVIFIFGVSWLTITAGMQKALIIGFYPYLIGAGIKIVLATIIVYSINKITK